MISEGKSGEGVDAVLIMEVRTRGDGVLGGVGGGTITGRDGIMLIIIISHHTSHGGKINNLVVITTEDLSTCTHLPGHGLGFPFNDLGRITTLVVDVLEVGNVVGSPVGGVFQPFGHITGMASAGNLLEDPEGTLLERLVRGEFVVVENHPLVIVETAVVESVPVDPVFSGARGDSSDFLEEIEREWD